MAINWEEFESDIREEYNGTTFVIERLDHEINVLLERRQAIMAKDVNPLVIQMDEILNSLDPHDFGGEYLYKSEWYKNLDLESWGIYKYTDNGNKEGINDNTILVDDLDGIEKGSELLIEIETGEKVQRTVSKVEYSDYYEGYLIYLDEDESTWDRKYMPDALYPRCIDPIDERACVAYNPCSDEFYKLPEWDDDLPEYVESDTIPLEVKYGVAPYTWTLIAGELDGWSLESEITNDRFNTLYSNNTCDLPAIVQVTDYCGNKTEEYMVINISQTEISLSAPSVIYQGDDYIVTINGGSPPFEWDIKEQASISSCSNNKCITLSSISTSGYTNVINTTNNACGSIIIRVKDKCGLISQCETEIYNTFIYKHIYSASYSFYYKDWRWSTHKYDDNKWPYIIPVRCIYSGHFSIKWLKQPKLQEISDLLYSTYYSPVKDNIGSKWAVFPQCGQLPNEINEELEKQDVTLNHEYAQASTTQVGYKPDFWQTAGTRCKYVDNSNYRLCYEQHSFGAGSGCCYYVGDNGPCGWSETIYPWERSFECSRSFCYEYYYYGRFLDPASENKIGYAYPVKSALSSLWIYGYKETPHSVGKYPVYSYCANILLNDANEEWSGTPHHDHRSMTQGTVYAGDEVNRLEKKICKTSNYIWESENFGDEPELLYIKTF